MFENNRLGGNKNKNNLEVNKLSANDRHDIEWLPEGKELET